MEKMKHKINNNWKVRGISFRRDVPKPGEFATLPGESEARHFPLRGVASCKWQRQCHNDSSTVTTKGLGGSSTEFLQGPGGSQPISDVIYVCCEQSLSPMSSYFQFSQNTGLGATILIPSVTSSQHLT